MGYFSNGTEFEMFESKFCRRCIHEENAQGHGCPIIGLHLELNYKECNNKDSLLHRLIPRTPNGCGNETCVMFHPKEVSA